MDYYSVIQKNEYWYMQQTQMNLMCIMLSERSLNQKAYGKGKTISTETDQWLPEAGDEDRGWLQRGMRESGG